LLGASVTPPFRGSDILSGLLRRLPKPPAIFRLNPVWRVSLLQPCGAGAGEPILGMRTETGFSLKIPEYLGGRAGPVWRVSLLQPCGAGAGEPILGMCTETGFSLKIPEYSGGSVLAIPKE